MDISRHGEMGEVGDHGERLSSRRTSEQQGGLGGGDGGVRKQRRKVRRSEMEEVKLVITHTVKQCSRIVEEQP